MRLHGMALNWLDYIHGVCSVNAKWFVIWFTIGALNGIQHEERRSKKKGSENRLFTADQVRELQEYIASVLLSLRRCVWLRNLHGNGVAWSWVSVNMAKAVHSKVPAFYACMRLLRKNSQPAIARMKRARQRRNAFYKRQAQERLLFAFFMSITVLSMHWSAVRVVWAKERSTY